MKHTFFVFALALCTLQLAAQTKPAYTTGYGSTITNSDEAPAPYIPDDRLSYGPTPWPTYSGYTMPQLDNLGRLYDYTPVAPIYDPGFVGGFGYSRGFHPRPATPPATITGRPFGPGTHHSGGRRR